MMNLPLLYWASEYTGDPRFSHMAVRHTETVLQNFIREDGSSKHICVFDAYTGKYVKNLGGQGYDENSAWTRGNAWALYGFALAYHYTKQEKYLETACRVADFYEAHLPQDYVPFADFLAPEELNVHKDTSAASAAASGLVLLAKLSGKQKYRDLADKQRQGVGSRFLREIETDIRTNGMTHVFLLTETDVPAYQFYRKNGFFELETNAAFAKRV